MRCCFFPLQIVYRQQNSQCPELSQYSLSLRYCIFLVSISIEWPMKGENGFHQPEFDADNG